MKIVRMNEIEGKINMRGVLAKELIDHETTRVMNLIMKPGEAVPAHEVPVDVFFYVVSGKGTIQIGEEKAVVEATDIVLCPPNTIMALWADQDEDFVVLNVKTPNMK
ncbi:cupin domain-containing protein [Alkalibacter rhizosphaerae]|uniref:Cupin domain-containing protein n=1 Tax=Alkalibacter rhizosphaerae TaxID=2815577 RepID=A0A975AIB3_9FIRM|nr:cupin domain-containing protein [Alkalibacter rhizosphaerae]QSX08499.1 cupin domain-containing protein [Alkalibacter rhizosphaerae]